ncbi:MAG: hypothetical protein LC623_09445 [Halobacteriales archaeon]|nr:hypothetical protein [Halobacteriales archaeon]
MRLPRVAGLLCLGFGLLVAGSGIGHSVASGHTAVEERGGLDGRFRLLLAVGWMLVAGGLALAAAGLALLRARPWGRPVALAACAFLLGAFSILYTIGGPIGIPVTLALAALVLLAGEWRHPFRAAARQG